MTIDPSALMAIAIPDAVHTYTERDTMLYALGIGFGCDPLDEEALRYTYEKDLLSAPTFPLVLSHPGFWMRDLDTGINWRKVVHGEQSITLHAPIPVAGTTVGRTKVVDIVDKGAGRGALVVFERTLTDQVTGKLLATMVQTNLCRDDGGFDGAQRESVQPAAPEGAPTIVVDLPTRPESALIYRLSADPNPLHVEPAAARAAGFPRPILHGLATFGIVGHAVLKSVCDYGPAKLRSLAGRFSNPVFPGETIRTEIWHRGDHAQLRALVPERGVVVLNAGRAELN